MTDLNNKLNINNLRSTYNNTPNFKKEEEVKPQPKAEETPEIINDGTQAADAYGRSLVKQAGKIENPEMIQTIKDAVDFYISHPKVAAASVKSGDTSYELLKAQGANDAYEKACCGSCDAAYAKING